MIYLYSALILLFSWWLPWWGLVFFGFFVGRFCKSLSKALYCGFIAPFFTWIVVAYYFDLRSRGMVSQKISALFGLTWSGWSFLMTGTFAGVVGLLSAGVGCYFWRWVLIYGTRRAEKFSHPPN